MTVLLPEDNVLFVTTSVPSCLSVIPSATEPGLRPSENVSEMLWSTGRPVGMGSVGSTSVLPMNTLCNVTLPGFSSSPQPEINREIKSTRKEMLRNVML